MKTVTISGITPNYPLDVEKHLIFTGTDIHDFKQLNDPNNFEYRSTGAKVIARYNRPSGDVIKFQISDEDAEVWLPRILDGWNKRNVKIEEAA